MRAAKDRRRGKLELDLGERSDVNLHVLAADDSLLFEEIDFNEDTRVGGRCAIPGRVTRTSSIP